jgi:tetratricopeptide (TPR) repeat protein
MGRLFAAGLSLLIASACTVPRPYEPPKEPPESTSEPSPPTQTQPGSPPSTVGEPQPLPEPISREPVLSPASKALVTQAQTQVAAKNYALAAGAIERALRIEPANALLWIELAKVRQAEGNYVQAENMARKAISMSVQAPRAQAQAWELVADTYRARGKNLEARQADAKAESLTRR